MKKKICMILIAVFVAVFGTSTYFTVRLKEDVRYELSLSVRTKSSAVNPMRVKNRPKRNRGTWKDS